MHAFAITIYAMVAASVLPLFTSVLAKTLGRFKLSDNANPRAFLANLTGIAARAQAAQANAYETLPVFLASVLMAQYLVLPQPLINDLAWAYVVMRVFYTLAYIANLSTLRSLIWTLSYACPMLLFFLPVVMH